MSEQKVPWSFDYVRCRSNGSVNYDSFNGDFEFHLNSSESERWISTKNSYLAIRVRIIQSDETGTISTGWQSEGRIPCNLGPFLGAARLVPFAKQSKGVRSVAVGEVLRRLVAKVLLHVSQKELLSQLYPLQVGVAVRGASELVAHAVDAFLNHDDAELCCLQLDFRNAFNKVRRSSIFAAVARQAPSLLPWVAFCYGSAVPLLLPNGDTIWSREGVQQGDPLGPVLFSLAIHPLVARLAEIEGVKWESFYMDDGTVIAPLRALPDVLHMVENEGPSFGLELNHSKTTVSGPGITREALASVGLDIPLGMKGSPPVPAIVVLGAPLGSSGFVAEHLDSCLERLARFHSAVHQLGNTQVALHLIRGSLGVCRITHLMRTVDPRLLRPHLEKFDALALSSLTQLLGRAPSCEAWAQAGLPIPLGGLGLPHATEVAPWAFAASNLTFISKVRDLRLPERLATPSSSLQAAGCLLRHSKAALTPEWSQFRSLLDYEHQAGLESLSSHLLSQKWWSQLVFEGRRLELVQCSSLRDRVRLQCLSLPLAGAWLTQYPAKVLGLSFATTEFQLLPLRFLGLPLG